VKPFAAELTLPNEVESLDFARDYLERIAARAELPATESAALVDAALEACANVIDHAYEPGEHGTFTVAASTDGAGVVIGVRDQGLPLDAQRLAAEAIDFLEGDKINEKALLALIRAAVDSAEWVHRGREGKELRLTKRRPAESIHARLDGDDPVDDEDQVPLAPEQEYVVRRFAPEDAIGVSRCIYRVYGNTYLHDSCYYPERLAALNENGELASVVAVTLDGEVVGHYALERPGLTRVAERGMAVVSPAHRGRDLMGRMRVFIEDEARQLGLTGVFSIAVTKHTFSQKVNEEFGSDVCGLFLGGGPESQVFRGLEEEGEKPQRVTWVVYFTYVDKPEKALVHAPARHRAVIERIYERLELPVEWHAETEEPAGDGALKVEYIAARDSGAITVTQVGADTDAELRRATADLFDVTGAEVVYLYLPLGDPSMPALMDVAEELGYSFAGVGPSFLDDGDALLMQRLDAPLDYSQIELATPFARELLDYVAHDRERVNARRAPRP